MVMYELRFLFFLQSKLGYYLPYGYIQRKADNDPPPQKRSTQSLCQDTEVIGDDQCYHPVRVSHQILRKKGRKEEKEGETHA